jgi:hypothetical protein
MQEAHKWSSEMAIQAPNCLAFSLKTETYSCRDT